MEQEILMLFLLLLFMSAGLCDSFQRRYLDTSATRRSDLIEKPRSEKSCARMNLWNKGSRVMETVLDKESEGSLYQGSRVIASGGDLKAPLPNQLSEHQMVYVCLTSVFVTCLIIADVIGVKLFEIPLPFPIFGYKTIEHSCGMLTFPVTFVLTDTINEYYGSKAAKDTVYIGLAMGIFVFVILNIAQAMPYLDKPFNVTPDQFDSIFGSAKLIYVASITAYLIGSLSDIWLFGLLKKATGGKFLWLRSTGSTVISQIVDSFVVSYIAFSLGKSMTGQHAATMSEVISISATGYGLKLFMATALTPVLYILKDYLKNNFGLVPIPVEQLEAYEDS